MTALAMTAEAVGLAGGVSDALRLAADALIHMSDEQLQKLMKCPVCSGTGKRRPLAGVPLGDDEEQTG